jgi:hypothetical protein
MARERNRDDDSAEGSRRDGAETLDLYSYLGLAACCPVQPRRSERQPIVVADDWPEVVPVTDAEVRMVEAHFGELLDALFGPLP